MKPTVLIVDDDNAHRLMLKTMLSGWGYGTVEAGDGQEAVEIIHHRPFDAVLMDVRMAGMDGITALGHIKAYNPAIPVLIMTAYGSVSAAVDAVKGGAYDYLLKPLDFDDLRITLERSIEHLKLKTENRDLRDKLANTDVFSGIIGSSRAMRDVLELAATVAPSEATVLITGESGTGKELIAKAVHMASARNAGPLVSVNCAALTETLLESELFGHEKGAFTGADKRREGRFQKAHGGTLFLDEIGEIAPQIQARLLRAIQQGEIQRLGSDDLLRVDVRVLAATNRDLIKEVEAGRFREDLYYRLNVVSIHVPPLRERLDDIPLLVEHFLNVFADKNRKSVRGFTPKAMDMMLKYTWPGNVRELENAVERAVILTQTDRIGENELPLAIMKAYPGESSIPSPMAGDSHTLEDIEQRAILDTLAACDNNKSEAARRLGITRATLHKKLKRYGVK
ncbi:sigma-54-dependent transcriptional regulator [Desulfovibrio inopinatus]|uniref:sigma-54-dependent transcriptional regulator n=1 Tax=Desulfovibrio inopinatus TaxID=102109 RepID=UPI00040AF0FF|nr:sigma-54 dependent transcriptional regulator [Desulfovibrio inopinatus]